MLCGHDLVKCLGLKELNQAAGEMLRRKLLSDRMTQTDAELQAAIAQLQRDVKYYER